MKKTIEELRNNGCYVVDGREYVLTEQASLTCDVLDCIDDNQYYNSYYSARAICLEDIKDEDGYQKCYMVRWEITESYDPEWDGEDCACDWDSPAEIKEQGEYNTETGCYY